MGMLLFINLCFLPAVLKPHSSLLDQIDLTVGNLYCSLRVRLSPGDRKINHENLTIGISSQNISQIYL